MACNGRPSVEKPAAAASPSDEELALRGMDKEQQAFLWEIKHHGNILSQIGFPALTKALRARDEKALADLLAPDFNAELPCGVYLCDFDLNGYLDVLITDLYGYIDGRQTHLAI
jgi:hypothetical protein